MIVQITPPLRPLSVLLVWAALCPAADPPAKDALGDPLPKGAIARLGTERMRKLTPSPLPRFHPDGKRLIVKVGDQLALLDPTTGDRLGAFAPGLNLGEFVLSADGSRLATAGGGVWDTATGKQVFALDDAEQKLARTESQSVALSASGQVLAVSELRDAKDLTGATIVVYDVDAKKVISRLTTAHNRWAFALLSADGKRAVSWGNHTSDRKPGQPFDEENDPNYLLQFWDVPTGKELARGRVPRVFEVTSVAISPAGDRVAASTGTGVCVFDVTTGKRERRLLSQGRTGWRLTFSADGKALAVAADDGSVQLWEVASGKSLGVAPPPVKTPWLPILSLVVTGPKQAVVAAIVGPAVMAWEVPSGKVLSPIIGHRSVVSGVTFANDDKELHTVGVDGEVIRWAKAGKRLSDFELSNPVTTTCMLASRTGGGVIFGRGKSGLDVFSLATGDKQFSLPLTTSDDPPVGLSADGKRMAVGLPGGHEATSISRLSVIDLDTNSETREVLIGPGEIIAVAVTPDGKRAGVVRIIRGNEQRPQAVVHGVDLETGKLLGEVAYKDTSYARLSRNMTAAPDNKSVLGNPPNSPELSVFDLTTGKARPVGDGRVTTTVRPVFSPDGNRVAIASDADLNTRSPQVNVYDWKSGKRTHTFSGHIGGVTCLAFSKDGKTLASGSSDTTVLLWDLSKPQKD